FRPIPRLVRYERAGIIAAHRYEGPTVVLAWKEYIDLVTTHRTDFRFPQLMRLGAKCKPIPIAMAVGVDLGLYAGVPNERIVLWNAAVVPETQRLAHVVIQGLRLQAQTIVVGSVTAQPVTVADGDVQRVIRSKHDPAGKVARCLPRVRD